ncbi:hypothetical protein LS68_008600 [Helicobacter sp. MIT 05-5293]|uniref:zinc ribbon domain-containing protein n=1 Tax=Helicobacter sp. MIT 05-5293 TaxID=1548149 RepID=UPI00051D9D1E|nr:zinc ribbon domain-containing protein [Helicobacter sp. MIT 05-5293]TLD80261.1 hypothetical protein LS68_008600 [Helicobacter sp. MIT 05-5293]
MNKHLRDLIEVANFDKQIDDLGPKIDEVRKELDEKIRQKNQILKNIENLHQEYNSINLEIAHHDRNIQETSLKLDTIAKKQKDIKTEKELRALDIEEDIAKENMTHSNNEIQRLEAVKSAKEEEKANLESQIQSLQEEIDVLESQTQSKVQEIKAIQQNLFDQKEALVAQMDNKITSFYAKIRRWALNTSVVPVFKQACGGCFIRLNDTIYAEILKGNDIINCPHCGRILYVPTDKAKVSSKTKAEA